MAGKKRQREEMEARPPSQPEKDSTPLTRLRNMWEFANLAQFLFLFGKSLKIDGDTSIEALETECLVPNPSERLFNIGLVLLKLISTQRGLNASMFDEYMQKEYRKRLQRQQESREWRGMETSHAENPFGDEEDPKRFDDLDIYTKIRVLQQLTQWALAKPELIREKMNEPEGDQLLWRVDIYGWDANEREYFLLDDNRLYRREDPIISESAPPPKPVKPKANSKKGKAAARASRRQSRLSAKDNEEDDEENAEEKGQPQNGEARPEEVKWELVALTLDDYNHFLERLGKSRDTNEKNLRVRVVEEIMPIIERAEEEQKRKAQKRERELLVLEKLSNVKRSSRVAAKQEREKEEQEALDIARKKLAEEIEARKALEKQRKLEKERIDRLMTREQRVQERGARRLQREQELANLAEEGAKLENGDLEGQARISERNLKLREADIRRELEELETEDWYFDCPGCGVHGRNIDDGKDIIACDSCNVWQHVECLNLGEQALKTDFEFICNFCIQMKKEAEKAAAAEIVAAAEKAAQEKVARENAAREKVEQEKAALERAAAHPPIMIKIGHLEKSQSPKHGTVTLRNGDSPAHKRNISGESSLHDQTSKRPKASTDVKTLDSDRDISGSQKMDRDVLFNSSKESQPAKSLSPKPIARPANAFPSAHPTFRPDFTPQKAQFVQQTQPIPQSPDYSHSSGAFGNRQHSEEFQRPNIPYVGRPNPLTQSVLSPLNPSPPAVVTPNGFPRQYQSPYGNARPNDRGTFLPQDGPSSNSPNTTLPHLSLPNDKGNSMSPRFHLPPSSSPTANGTSPGTLPHHSTGLSPTKHATTAGSPAGVGFSPLHSPARSLGTPLQIQTTPIPEYNRPRSNRDRELWGIEEAGKGVQQLSPSVGQQLDLTPPTKTFGQQQQQQQQHHHQQHQKQQEPQQQQSGYQRNEHQQDEHDYRKNEQGHANGQGP